MIIFDSSGIHYSRVQFIGNVIFANRGDFATMRMTVPRKKGRNHPCVATEPGMLTEVTMIGVEISINLVLSY